MSKVMILALDAMQADLMRRFLAEDRLPNLARLASESQLLDVSSNAEYFSGSVWPSFVTGLPAGGHGIYFWTQWVAEQMRHELTEHVTDGLEPFWRALVPAGQTATIIDVPYIPLVREPGFRSVSGWGQHEELVPESYPDGFRPWIIKAFGKHTLKPDTIELKAPAQKLEFARSLGAGAVQRCRLLEDIAARQDWNLLLALFGEVHQSGHYLSAEEQLTPNVSSTDARAIILQGFDDRLPHLLKAAGADCNVMVLSIHGMVEQREYEAMGAQVMSLFAGRAPSDWYANPDLLRRMRDLVPDSLHRAIWRSLPSTWRESRQHTIASSSLDLAHDKLFSVSHDTTPAVRVNLAGRERLGFVPPEDVPALLDQLQAFIEDFHTEDGQRAFIRVWRTAEEEPGPRSHRLPDALLLTNPELKAVTKLLGPGGVVITSAQEEVRNGVHDGRGFCYFRPANGGSATRSTVDNLDFAPSVLDLLGVPPDREFAGRSFIA